MNVRSAKISDVTAINALINSYAEQDRMLFRSMADIYENLQTFIVAELDENIVSFNARTRVSVRRGFVSIGVEIFFVYLCLNSYNFIYERAKCQDMV